MSKKKRLISVALLGILLGLLTACEPAERILILKLDDGKDISELKEAEFPTAVKLSYSMNEKYYDYAKDRTFAIQYSNENIYLKNSHYVLIEANKVEGGYKLDNDDYRNFVVPNIFKLDGSFKSLVHFRELNGTLTLEVDSYEELEQITHDLQWDYIGWAFTPVYENTIFTTKQYHSDKYKEK